MTDALLPDLSLFDRVAIDTETTGVSRTDVPVGLSWATPDGRSAYAAWGHERGGNNVALADVQAWARRELMRADLTKVFFNAPFDLRMLAAVGVVAPPALMPGVEDAGTSAALLDENEPSYALDRLAQKHLGEQKEDDYLNEWCAAQFGGKPWRSAQGGNYWRAPGDLVEAYAAGDARLTLALHDRNRPMLTAQGLDAIYRTETAVIPIVVNMHLYGVRVDRARAEEVNRGLLTVLDAAKARWCEVARDAGVETAPPSEWKLPSTAQSSAVFRALGVPCVGTTEKGNDSVTKDLIESAAEEHESARVLLAIRELTKQSGTFVQGYILDQADEDDVVHGEFHPMPVEYKPGKRYGTVSGRFSSWLHNVPGDRNPEAGRLIRSLFVPYHADSQWVKADYSQIEYRFLGHYAGGSIARAYNAASAAGACPACGDDHSVVGADFHCMLTLMIGMPEVCNRRRTKNVNFAKVYGAGLQKAAETAGITVKQWKEVLATYDAKVPEVDAIYRKADRRANERGYIVTWGGRRCRFPTAAQAKAWGWRLRPGELHAGTFKALNRLLQGSAADLIKKAMVRIAGPGGIVDWETALLHLQVHDELDLSAPRGAAGETFVRRLTEAMCDGWGDADGVPPLSVPIRAGIKTAASWGATVK